MKLNIFDQEAAFDELVNLFNLQKQVTVSDKRVAKWVASKQAWQVTKSVAGVGQIVFCLKSKELANEATDWLDNDADLSCISEKNELNEFTRQLKQRFNQHNLSC